MAGNATAIREIETNILAEDDNDGGGNSCFEGNEVDDFGGCVVPSSFD